jgi:hypothetical protein
VNKAHLTKAALYLSVLGAAAPALVAQQAWSGLSPETQIALAVQAAPEEMRDDATVQGYDAAGAFVTLREGSNDLV